jgi:hypothetical protein
MRSFKRVPSVIGGHRPHVRDDAQMAFRSVQYTKAEVSKTETKLRQLKDQLEREEWRRKSLCVKITGKCGSCSACIG